MRLNTAKSQSPKQTHEGAIARRISNEQQLRRSVLSCLLWEKEFYEDGFTISDRISETAALCHREFVETLAIEARNEHGLRHVPLLLLLDLVSRGGQGTAQAIYNTIRRPDEITELLALYWKDGKKPLPRQLKLGLGAALGKFSEYQLAKYNRDGPIKLRDILFLTCPKPKDREQEALFRRLANKELKTPDTWETSLSSGKDKKETFERLIKEGKLGYFALLSNLRNMMSANCDIDLVKDAIIARKGADLVLPFRYVAAARACPQLEPAIDQALCENIASGPCLEGKTVVLVDVSGSMKEALSARSDMTRMIAAASLASLINADTRVFTFSEQTIEVPPRRGIAGVDTICNSQRHGGTNLGAAVEYINKTVQHQRLIVITDEQSRDRIPDPVVNKAYMINVASNKNGVGYGKWTHIDGFSEAVLRFIIEHETNATNDR